MGSISYRDLIVVRSQARHCVVVKRVPKTSVSSASPRIRRAVYKVVGPAGPFSSIAVAGLSNMLSDSISLGYELVVVVLTATTYVVTTSHVGLYFSQNRKWDSRTFRIMVFALWVVDTCCTAVVSYSVAKFMNGKMCIHSHKSPSPYPWTFALENACFMMFAIQGFFVVRAWICTGYADGPFPNQPSQLAHSVKQSILITLMTVALCALGTSIVLTIKPFSHQPISSFSRGAVLFCVGILAFTTTFDIVVTLLSCYCLGTKRQSVLQWVSKYRDDVTYYVYARLIITATVQVAATITYCLFVKKDVWMLGHLTLSKVYTNNILAIINSRLDDPDSVPAECEYSSEKVEIIFIAPIDEEILSR
ncbi:hypothetical protein IW261DRAFT_1509757 [Armillaria novae-zelandiae]|uniref:Uncharacterized protein n=1 Tax=Armillaria novae-zelandiae TaxID=153914 RepID=A0AA39TWI4_9AGAR|nr:hypothetical protein IW261DRAFT_1509757 [Armillaria novae-zelandiae]